MALTINQYSNKCLTSPPKILIVILKMSLVLSQNDNCYNTKYK